LVNLCIANRERLADSFPSSVAELADARDGAGYVAARVAEAKARKGFWFGLWDGARHELVGQAQLKNLEWSIPRAELAYWIDQRFEGQGRMSEAIAAL